MDMRRWAPRLSDRPTSVYLGLSHHATQEWLNLRAQVHPRSPRGDDHPDRRRVRHHRSGNRRRSRRGPRPRGHRHPPSINSSGRRRFTSKPERSSTCDFRTTRNFPGPCNSKTRALSNFPKHLSATRTTLHRSRHPTRSPWWHPPGRADAAYVRFNEPGEYALNVLFTGQLYPPDVITIIVR